MLPLEGQRVLVTRPAHQAGPLCQALTAEGAEPVRFPTLAIQPAEQFSADLAQLKNCFLELDNYYAVIFVSANAARLGCDWIDAYWPQLPLAVHWLAVGSATVRTLNEQGLDGLAPEAGMDSESLLQLPQLQRLQEQRVLICRGLGGRELLAESLISRGARVDYAELYRRVAPDYEDQDIESIIYKSLPSVMLVNSIGSLENLHRLIRGRKEQLPAGRLTHLPMIVPSQRVADRAAALGYGQISVAENATDTAMIKALKLSLQ